MRTLFFRFSRYLGGVVGNDCKDQLNPLEPVLQMMPLIKPKIIDCILRLSTARAAQAFPRKYFAGQDIETEEVFRSRASGPCTWIHISPRRPFLTLCMVASVTGKQPVRPEIDDVRVSALGTKVVHFSPAAFLAIGTEAVKCVSKVVEKSRHLESRGLSPAPQS